MLLCEQDNVNRQPKQSDIKENFGSFLDGKRSFYKGIQYQTGLRNQIYDLPKWKIIYLARLGRRQ